MEKELVFQILKRLESGYHIPPLSAIAVKLVEMASDEHSSVRQMAALIEKEPSLAVRVLHLANSVVFGMGGQVKTLNQAAVRLGVHRLKLMALSISLRDAFPLGRVGPFNYEDFWKLSLYRGLMARGLAERSRRHDPDEAFLAALTLEVGLPIFFDMHIKGKHQDFDMSLDPLEELLFRERDLTGMDHRNVGKAALKFWKFPESIIACQPVYGHLSREAHVSALCLICEMARLFSRMVLDPSVDFTSFFIRAEESLQLSQDIVQDLLVEVFSEVQETALALRLDVDQERDLMGIMEGANRALIRISEKMSRHSAWTSGNTPLPSFETLSCTDDSTLYTLQAVAHEIRNPLTAVGGFARRLAQSVESDSQVARYANVILEEAKRLEIILAQMKSR